jgi:hypothetical protein
LEDRLVLSGWTAAVDNNPAYSYNYNNRAMAVATDVAGNVYATGKFDKTATLGSLSLTSNPANVSGNTDIWVAKLDPNGNFLWAEGIGGAGADAGTALQLDAAGNLYVAGYFGDNTDLDPTTDFDPGPGTANLTSAGHGDAFLLKLGPTGNYLWARAMGSWTGDGARNLAVDSSGNAYLTGWVGGNAGDPVTFGPFTLASAGGQDAFLAKLDAAGNFVWAQVLGGPEFDVGFGVAVDGAGNMYSSGSTYVSKRDTAGNLLWSQTVSGASAVGVAAYADPATGTEFLYVTGSTTDSGTIGTITLAPAGAFVLKEDADSGAVLWARDIAGNIDNSATPTDAIAVDGSGNVYTAGNFSGVVDFDPGSGSAALTSNPDNQTNGAYVSKLDPSGNFVAARRLGGTGPYSESDVYAISVDATGNIYTAGEYQGAVTFDTGTGTVSRTLAGGNGGFIVKTTQDNGGVFGRIFNDLNGNGAWDANEPPLKGQTVYLDVNGNSQFDAGEPSAVTDAGGYYVINNAAPGTFTLRQALPSGWQQTYPAGGANYTVSFAAGQFVDSKDYGDYTPTTTRTYANKTVVKTTAGKPNAVSTLAISDNYPIFDLNITLNVSNTKNKPLTVILRAPDGTAVTLVASTNFNGTVTYHTTGFNYLSVKGTWTLEVDGLAGGTLNSWSMSALEPTI